MNERCEHQQHTAYVYLFYCDCLLRSPTLRNTFWRKNSLHPFGLIACALSSNKHRTKLCQYKNQHCTDCIHRLGAYLITKISSSCSFLFHVLLYSHIVCRNKYLMNGYVYTSRVHTAEQNKAQRPNNRKLNWENCALLLLSVFSNTRIPLRLSLCSIVLAAAVLFETITIEIPFKVLFYTKIMIFSFSKNV